MREEWKAGWVYGREVATAAFRHPAARWIGMGAGAGLVLGILAVLYASAPVVLDEETEKITFFQIGTGASDGLYFSIGGRLAAIITRPPDAVRCERSGPCGVEGLLAVVKSSAGSVANVRAVSAGHFSSALVQSTTLDQAYRGNGAFRGEKPFKNLRAIASVFHEQVHVVASRGANVHSMSDLKGKRVAVGTKGSATARLALDILRAYGLTAKNLDIVREDAERAAELVLRGRLDAFFLVDAAPSDIVADLSSRGTVDIVPIDGEAATQLVAASHRFRAVAIPANTYRLSPAIETLGVSAVWICSTKAEPDLVHGITQALFYPGNRELLPMNVDLPPQPRKPDKAAEAAARRALMESATANLPIPLHEGAARFYREEGVLPPD